MDYAYHRLARSWPKYAWWKPLVTGLIGLVIYVVLSIAYLAIFVALSFPLPDVFGEFTRTFSTMSLDLADPVTFAFAIGSIGLMLPAIILATLIMGARPVGLLSSVAGRIRWRWLVRCIPLALVAYGAVFGLSLLLEPAFGAEPLVVVVTPTTWVLIALTLLLIPLQATAEEYVFRGYLMQTIGGWLKHPAWAILLPVPLFAIGHDYDLWGLADVAIFAVTAAWLTWRTGGLEAAIVAHVVNNSSIFVLGAFGLVDLNADSGSAIGIASTLLIMVAYSALVVWRTKRTGLETTRTVHPTVAVANSLVPVAPQGGA